MGHFAKGHMIPRMYLFPRAVVLKGPEKSSTRVCIGPVSKGMAPGGSTFLGRGVFLIRHRRQDRTQLLMCLCLFFQ